MRARLIRAGVNNLKQFGYPHVDATNILTDDIYKEFFRVMLKDTLGQRADLDQSINALLEEIK